MSNAHLNQCWPIKLPLVAKSVLIAMADYSDDSGVCWPSIDSLCERTCAGRTAVIDAIKYLEKCRLILIDKHGCRGNKYCLQIEQYEQVEKSARQTIQSPQIVREADQSARRIVREADQNSPADVLEKSARRTGIVREAHPNHQLTIKEPSGNHQLQKPADVSDQVWIDFKALRKAKKAALTETALDGIRREAGTAGVTLDSALATCCERGWQGFKAEWLATTTPRSNGKPSVAEVAARNQDAFAQAKQKLFGNAGMVIDV